MALEHEQLKLWQARLEHAKRLQTQQHRRWMEAQWMLEGTWFERQGIWDYDSTPVNYTIAYVRTIVAAIYNRNPYIFVRSENSRYQGFADTLETVVNYYWRILNMKAQIKRNIVDAVLCGVGWNDVGYHATFETIDPAQADGTLLSRLFRQSRTPEEQGVLNEYIKEFSIYATRVSPWQMLLAPGYHSVSQMPYLIQIEDLSPEDLKNHPLYRKGVDVDALRKTRAIKVGNQMLDTTTKPSPTTTHGELVMHRLFHVFDRRNQQRLTLFEGSDESVGPFPWSSSFAGFLQVPLIFNEMPETKDQPNGYPMSDITPMIPQLKELYWLRTAMVRHRRRSGTLILTRKGAMTEEQRRNLQTGDDVAVIEVDDPAGIINHSPPQLSPDIFRVNAEIKADLDLIGGLSQVLLAAAPTADRTATEVNLQAQGMSLRTGEKVDAIEEFSVEIARRMAALLWEFYQGPFGRQRIAEIIGESTLTEAMWPTLPDDPEERRQLIQGEVQVSIEAGSTTAPKDRMVERQQWLSAISTLGSLAPERINKAELVMRTLKRFDEKDLDLVVIGHDQEEQQAAMQEEQLLAQNIPQVVGPNEAHDVHLQVHGQASMQQPPTDARDKHILAHQQALQAKMPARPNQQGDTKAPATSVNPEQQRKGVPSMPDMMSSIGQTLRTPGQERGGMPNL